MGEPVKLPSFRDRGLQDDAAAPSPEPWSPGPCEDDDPLIFWMLGLTPAQRLEVAQDFVDSIQVLRRGRLA
jgi:hypothetical protein